MLLPYLAFRLQIIALFTTCPVLAFLADELTNASPQQPKDDLFAAIDTMQAEDDEKQGEESVIDAEDLTADEDNVPVDEDVPMNHGSPIGDELSKVQLDDKNKKMKEDPMKSEEDTVLNVEAIPMSSVLPSFEDILQSEGTESLQSDETSEPDAELSPRDDKLIRELIEVLKLPMKTNASNTSSKNQTKSGIRVSIADEGMKGEGKGFPLLAIGRQGEDILLPKDMEHVEVAPDNIDTVFPEDMNSDNPDEQRGADNSNIDVVNPSSKANDLNEDDVIPGASSDNEMNEETSDEDEDVNPSADESDTSDFNIPAMKSNDENLSAALRNKKLQYLLDQIKSIKSKMPAYDTDYEEDKKHR